MEEGFWRWQHGVPSELFAVTVLPDGSPVVAGAEWSDSEGWDFLAIKLDPVNEAITWEWKNGSGAHDVVKGVAPGANGSVVLTGYTYRVGDGGEQGNENSSAIMLDSDGNFMWQWQSDCDRDGLGHAVVNEGEDSVVVAGGANGIWEGPRGGSPDFSTIKLRARVDLSTWKEPRRRGSVRSVLKTEDGSVILYGDTRRSPLGTDGRAANVATVVKMDANGRELWSWQGDSSGISSVSALVMGREEIVVLGGCGTSSRRSRTSRCNFMLLELSAIDGSVVRGPWQASTSEGDEIHAMAALYDNSIILAGSTDGSSASRHDDNKDDGDDDGGQDLPEGVVVMVSTGAGSGMHTLQRSLTHGRPPGTDSSDAPLPAPAPTPSVVPSVDEPTLLPTASTPPPQSPETMRPSYLHSPFSNESFTSPISGSDSPPPTSVSPESNPLQPPSMMPSSDPPSPTSESSDSNPSLPPSMAPDSVLASPDVASTSTSSSMTLLISSLLVFICFFGIIATGIILKRQRRQAQDANNGYPGSTTTVTQHRGEGGSRTLEPAPPLATAIILAPATVSSPGHGGARKGGRVQSVAVDRAVLASVEDNPSSAPDVPRSHARDTAGTSGEPPSYSRPLSGEASIAIATPAVGNEERHLRTVNVSRVYHSAPFPIILPP